MVADDQPVAVSGTTLLLPANGVEVCAVVDDLRRIGPVFEVQQPDIVLLETSMGTRADVAGTIAELMEEHPRARVVAFTATLSTGLVDAVLDAGCRGIIPKTASIDALVGALETVARGERFLHPKVVALLLGRLRDPAPLVGVITLSTREREVLLRMAEGRSNRMIGEELGISETTVKTHVVHLLRKLGATDRAQAVSRGLRSGIIA